ncbi:hypothetical protein LTR62_008436 [Meristemomyces frigidus]|uniref:Uncharacterized protein n=1 Tax=Meristemomyces frigidus TaxID=1508187 RepID=A0AAN7YH53_9PEZI|nr:hypothetical protein LTR62_008436 [Meristemomyces frigidus]
MWLKSTVVLGSAAILGTAQAQRGQQHERRAPTNGYNSTTTVVVVAPVQYSTTTATSYASSASSPLPSQGASTPEPLPYGPPSGNRPSHPGLPPTQSPSSLPAYTSTSYTYEPASDSSSVSENSTLVSSMSPSGTAYTSMFSYVPETSSSSAPSSTPAPPYFAPSPVGPGTAPYTMPYISSYGTRTGGYSYSNASNSTAMPGTTSVPTAWPSYYNGTDLCQGATLNVLNASLDWWYATTFTEIASTLSVSTNLNGTTWSLVPASTTFNITSAIASPSCSLTITETSGWQGTYSYWEGTCYQTPTPKAASTSVVTVSAYMQLNVTAGNGTVPPLVTPPPVASATIPAVNVTANTTSAGVFSQGTPFVYFSQYQVIKKTNTTHAYHGGPVCAESTQVFNLSEPFSFAYSQENVQLDGVLNVGANVTGDVNPALLGIVGQQTAVAGSWVAAPTVVFVLKKVLAASASAVPFAPTSGLTLSSILETITPQLPPGFSTQSAQGSLSGVGITIRVPQSQPVLLLPSTSVPSTTTPAPTLIPATASGTSGAGNNGGSSNDGGSNTGGSNTGGSNTGGSNNGGSPPNLSNLISNVVSAAQPTNALQVLSDAQATANPTIGAIVAGLGGSNNQGGGGGSALGGSGSNSGGGSVGTSGSNNNGGSGAGSGTGQTVVVGGTTFTVTPTSDKGVTGIVVAAGGSTATLTPGQTTTVGGQSVSMPASGSGVTIGSGSGATFVSPSSSGSNLGGSTGAGSNGGSAGQIAVPAAVIVVAGSTATAQTTPAFVVGGQTAVPGGSPITVNGHTIAVAAGATAVVVDGSTQPLAGSIASPTVFNVNNVPITASPAGGFNVGGQTLQPGGGAITVDGTTLSLVPGGSAVVVNGQTSVLSNPQSAGAAAVIPLLTVGSQTFTANAATQFSLAPGATLTPGGQVVVSGTTISLANDARTVVVNGQSQALNAPLVTPAPAITVGNIAFQANAGSTYDINGQMLTPGGVITVSGTTISLAAGATAVVFNGKTTMLTAGPSPTTPHGNMATITAPPVLTVDGQAFAANGKSSYIISGQTLTPGGVITISGAAGTETISLNSAANQLVSIVSGTTYTSMVGAIGAMSTGAPLLTVNGQTYTAIGYDTGAGPTYIISGQTLTRGGAITIAAPNGGGGKETLSLEAAGTALEIILSGTTSISQIPSLMALLPTSAPVLTIAGQTFTAINNGATYLIDGQTLTPGESETVTLAGKTYVISLAPQATLLEIMSEDGSGKVTKTEFETLFPAQMTGSTLTNTLDMGFTSGTAAGTAASGTAAAGKSSAGSRAARVSRSPLVWVTAVVVGVGSFGLAVWL